MKQKLLLLTLLSASLSTACFSQTRKIAGKVYGEGTALPGVNVFLKGTTTGTVTDANGEFSLDVPVESVTLVFSFGCAPVERQVKKHESYIKVNIEADARDRTTYALVGPLISKLSDGRNTNFGLGLSIGYRRFFFYPYGFGTEISFLQNKMPDEDKNFYQVGIPLIGYRSLFNYLRIELGAGYYWTLDKPHLNNDIKILAGFFYERRLIGLGLRYLNGTIKVDDNHGRISQTMQISFHYRVR